MSAQPRPRSVWAIVVAAGEGRRYGGLKQYHDLGGTTVLSRSVEMARAVAGGVVVVIPPSRIGDPDAYGHADVAVSGGPTRSASVRAGLEAVPGEADVIVVHDAARPLASAELFDSVVDAVVDGADGAVPGVALTDTVKRVEDGVVVATLDRSDLVSIQTPQAFRADALRSAHVDALDATDDAALVERAGGRVVVVPGETSNIKITDPSDLEIAARFLAERSASRS